MACIVVFLPVISCVIFATSDNELLLFLACALMGLAAGAELDLLAFLTARFFGLVHYSKIYALLYGALAAGSAIAPTFFARVHDATGTYQSAFVVAGALFALGALLLPVLGRYPVFASAAPADSDTAGL